MKHPLVEAGRRYFQSENGRNILDVVSFLDYLAMGLHALPPQSAAIACEGLLDVASELHASGRFDYATALSRMITKAARRVTATSTGAAPLSARTETAGERFLAFVGAKDLPRATRTSQDALPRAKSRSHQLIADRWSSMSDKRKSELSSLADELLARL